MNESFELLETVYQDADMSKTILHRLIKLSSDLKLSKALACEFAEYHNITEDAEKLADELNISLSKKNHAKNAIISGIRMNTLINKSPEHIADMLVQGSVMGLIDIKRCIKENPDADSKAMRLALRLYKTEFNNMNNMLEFV